MSRNRLSELQPPPNGYDTTQAYPQGQYDNVDLERNDDIAGERYELQDRSARQLTLNEYLDEVRISMSPLITIRSMIAKSRHQGWMLKSLGLSNYMPNPWRQQTSEAHPTQN
jgi:hypothetical protein